MALKAVQLRPYFEQREHLADEQIQFKACVGHAGFVRAASSTAQLISVLRNICWTDSIGRHTDFLALQSMQAVKAFDLGFSGMKVDSIRALGFSGATMFLLDRNQPYSVKEEDFGKANAIHCSSPRQCGTKPTLVFSYDNEP